MTMSTNQLADSLLELARTHYGDTGPETDEQYLFALLCDAVRTYTAVVNERTDAMSDELDREYVTEEEIAQTLAPVVANICPAYVIKADAYSRAEDP